jgi:hypothetical protein
VTKPGEIKAVLAENMILKPPPPATKVGQGWISMSVERKLPEALFNDESTHPIFHAAATTFSVDFPK